MVTTEREKPPSQARNLIVIIQPAVDFLEKTGIKARMLDGISVEEQISRLIIHHALGRQRKKNSPPEYFLVAETTKEQLLRAAVGELEKRPDRYATKGCFASLVLIESKAEKPSDNIDTATGIRVVGITDGQFRFPTHPSPTH